VQGQKLAQAWKRSRELDREREVSTANRWLVPPAVWLVSAFLTLRKSSHANQNR